MNCPDCGGIGAITCNRCKGEGVVEDCSCVGMHRYPCDVDNAKYPLSTPSAVAYGVVTASEELQQRANRERLDVGGGVVRPLIHELKARGNVTAAEWSLPMNSYERRELLSVLELGPLFDHFLHCASNVDANRLGTYNWSLVHDLVPEMRKRLPHGIPSNLGNFIYGKLTGSSAYGKAGLTPDGRERATLAEAVETTDAALRSIHFRSAYPEGVELEIEARAMVRRTAAGVDGLDWDRRRLAAALRLAPLLPVEDRTPEQLRADRSDYPVGERRGDCLFCGGCYGAHTPDCRLYELKPLPLVEDRTPEQLRADGDDVGKAAVEPLDTLNWAGVSAKDGRVVMLLPPYLGMAPEAALQLAAWLIVGAGLAGHDVPLQTAVATVAAIEAT